MNFLKYCFGKIAKAVAWSLWASPRFIRRLLGVILGTLWFDVFRIRRRLVIENIERAFPNIAHAKAISLGRRSLYNLGQNFVEYSFLPFLNQKNVHRRLIFENPENLRKALDRKKGVILITLHMGNGDLAVAGLSLLGYPMVLVSKLFKLKWLNDLWFGMREKLGTEFIPPRDSSFQLLKKLKAGKVVVIPLDQFTGPPIGVKTTFFGVETGTAAGPALMALRSGAAVVPAYTFRNLQGRHEIHMLPEIDMESFKQAEDPSLAATQYFNHILEDLVRKHPDQWMWIHRRWKRFVVA